MMKNKFTPSVDKSYYFKRLDNTIVYERKKVFNPTNNKT